MSLVLHDVIDASGNRDFGSYMFNYYRNKRIIGGGEAPKNLSGRLVAATWWLFGFIIIASYTANLAAFLTVSRLDTPIESLTDLSNQYKIQYAPMNGSSTMTYFERMAGIEDRFYEIWKDMSLDDTMNEVERAKLAVWDYPVSDKYTKMWQSMQEAGLPKTFEDALERVRASKSSSEGFAYLGDATDIRYQVLTNCDLQIVGEEFSRKPYALAVQQGSPLKDQLNDAGFAVFEDGVELLFTTQLCRKEDNCYIEKYRSYGENVAMKYSFLSPAEVVTHFIHNNTKKQTGMDPRVRAVAKQPLNNFLRINILKLLNQRKLETLKERWWNQNPEKKECEEEDDQSEGISIENIGGVFIVIFVGIGLACITLAFEYWWYKGGRATRVTDSSRVVSVKEFAPPKKDKFALDKSNFDTEYKLSHLLATKPSQKS
ncbi:Ionotropic receptor 25a [Armadillidium nasatum]|uniref:Ionotropic receptor 25a n=1 Tax=Armadillidium nasatum TaxID=96803 RepID=A0A5N5SLD9_9CRUS|nr:Ionotropic receptor 25a [Armadillidium nasatum]